MNRKRHTLLKRSIAKNLRAFGCLVAACTFIGLAQYIANQPTLTAFEKAIFPSALTAK